MFIHGYSAIGHNIDLTTIPQPFTRWGDFWCARVDHGKLLQRIDFERSRGKYFEKLDLTGKLAVTLVRRLLEKGFEPDSVVIGSARGATGMLEAHHGEFAFQGRVSVQSSPLTTAGNIAASAAMLNELNTPSLTVSMTCSSALHALIIGISKLRSGMAGSVIAGGVEAPVTPFTRAQFEVLRLLARHDDLNEFPCRPFTGDEVNRVVLAEGGALFTLSLAASPWRISGWGEAAENIVTPVGLAGGALRKSMTMALMMAGAPANEVDLVIAHAPGTALGDPEELGAVREVCGDHPRVVSGKWLTGHSLGASGALALVQALQAMEVGFPELPYISLDDRGFRGIPQRVLINATGFGGNAASIVVERFEG